LLPSISPAVKSSSFSTIFAFCRPGEQYILVLLL